MKKIVYQNYPNPDIEFFLTDEEFEEAIKTFNQGGNYWCKRLEKLLTTRFKWAGTPLGEEGYEVFFLPTASGLQKVYKKDNKYYQLFEAFEGEKTTKKIKCIRQSFNKRRSYW